MGNRKSFSVSRTCTIRTLYSVIYLTEDGLRGLCRSSGTGRARWGGTQTWIRKDLVYFTWIEFIPPLVFYFSVS